MRCVLCCVPSHSRACRIRWLGCHRRCVEGREGRKGKEMEGDGGEGGRTSCWWSSDGERQKRGAPDSKKKRQPLWLIGPCPGALSRAKVFPPSFLLTGGGLVCRCLTVKTGTHNLLYVDAVRRCGATSFFASWWAAEAASSGLGLTRNTGWFCCTTAVHVCRV